MNGIAGITSPSVDLLHPSVGYPGKYHGFITLLLLLLLLLLYISMRFNNLTKTRFTLSLNKCQVGLKCYASEQIWLKRKASNKKIRTERCNIQ